MSAGVLGVLRRVARRAMHAEHLRRRRKVMGEDGLAANPDHLAVRDATLDAASLHQDVTVVLFEDLPYLWHARGDDEVARVLRQRGLTADRITVPVNTAAKHSHLALYTSQMPVMDRRRRLMRSETLPSQEVYWVSSASPKPS